MYMYMYMYMYIYIYLYIHMLRKRMLFTLIVLFAGWESTVPCLLNLPKATLWGCTFGIDPPEILLLLLHLAPTCDPQDNQVSNVGELCAFCLSIFAVAATSLFLCLASVVWTKLWFIQVHGCGHGFAGAKKIV